MILFDEFKNAILLLTLRHEGGYVNDPADRGGETYRGISRKANPDWKGWELLKKHLPLKRGDIVNDYALNCAIAELYWDKYFQANSFNLIKSRRIAMLLFDFAVHGGFYRVKLQELLNTRFCANLKLDGVIGVKTLEAVNSSDTDKLAKALLDWRKSHLQAIIEKNPAQMRFEKGWNNRLSYLAKVKE